MSAGSAAKTEAQEYIDLLTRYESRAVTGPAGGGRVVEVSGFGSYFAVLQAAHRHLEPQRYLEIGVFKGYSLALAQPRTRIVGVDPAPQLASSALRPNTIVVTDTSDGFFGRGTTDPGCGPGLAGGPFDMAFVDGLHHFEQALRDVMNAEAHCGPGATIFLHDCLPVDGPTSSRDRSTTLWSGDVFKTMLALRRFRPDLDAFTVDAAPTGMGVIRNLDPPSTVLFDRFDEIVELYSDLEFDDLVAMGMEQALGVTDRLVLPEPPLQQGA